VCYTVEFERRQPHHQTHRRSKLRSEVETTDLSVAPYCKNDGPGLLFPGPSRNVLHGRCFTSHSQLMVARRFATCFADSESASPSQPATTAASSDSAATTQSAIESASAHSSTAAG